MVLLKEFKHITAWFKKTICVWPGWLIPKYFKSPWPTYWWTVSDPSSLRAMAYLHSIINYQFNKITPLQITNVRGLEQD